MDLEYSVDSSISGILANFSAPVTSSTIPVFVPSSTVPSSSASRMASATTPSVVSSTTSSALLPSPTTAVVSSSQLGEVQKRIVEGLEEAAKAFKEAARPSPPVVVVNQLPPPTSSSSWQHDPDPAAVGGGVLLVVVLLLLVGGCWLRKYRPDHWKTVKTRVWGLVIWLALPLSWCCGQLSVLFQHLHSSAEGQRASSANSVQVSKPDSYRFTE